MALRYGSKDSSALRYSKFSSSALRHGGKTTWTGGGPTNSSYFKFTLLADDTYSIAPIDVDKLPANTVLPGTYEGKPVTVIDQFIPTVQDGIDSWPASFAFNLKTVHIPASVTTIGDNAFRFCLGLVTVTFEKGSQLRTIGKYAFCSGIVKIDIPDGVTTIGDHAFDASQLIDITIPDSVTTIGVDAFAYSSLKSVVFGAGITEISNRMFESCEALERVVFTNNIISIGGYAFAFCRKLTGIFIPYTVTTIDNHAFSGCENLTICCEATEKPEGWADNWNPDNRPVVWGYEGE